MITSSHEITYVSKCQPAPPYKDLPVEEKIVAHRKEKKSRSKNLAYKRVNKGDVEAHSIKIGCRVMDIPKARIVLCGHKDAKKNSVRGDTSSLNFDALHLTIFIAAERSGTMKKMDVKTTYFQAKEFCRNNYVRLSKKKQDQYRMLRLLQLAYGLPNSGRLWNFTLHETPTSQCGLERSKLDPSIYFLRRKQEMLMLIVQAHDYLETGTPDLALQFENFLISQFQLGSLEPDTFYIIKAKPEKDISGAIISDDKEKLSAITKIRIPLTLQGKSDYSATFAKTTLYWSVVEKLLYFGRPTIPVIGFYASDAAAKCKAPKLHYCQALH